MVSHEQRNQQPDIAAMNYDRIVEGFLTQLDSIATQFAHTLKETTEQLQQVTPELVEQARKDIETQLSEQQPHSDIDATQSPTLAQHSLPNQSPIVARQPQRLQLFQEAN